MISSIILVLTWVAVIFIWVSTRELFDSRHFLDWVAVASMHSLIPLLIGGWLMSLFK